MRPSKLALLTVIFALMVSLWPVKADGPHDTVSNSSAKEIRQWEVTGPWGGDVRTLVAAPDNTDLFYLGTSDGQIFRSDDGTMTWRRLKPGLGERGLSIDSIVIDPRDSRRLYIGAWAVGRDVDGGVFKSEDGGEHWKL